MDPVKAAGTHHPFAQVDAARTAHIAVDLQNGFLEPGQPVEFAAGRGVIANVNRIIAAARRAGAMNIFLQHTIDAASLAGWTVSHRELGGGRDWTAVAAAFAEGSHGWDLWPELAAEPGDVCVSKTRYSPFVPGASRLSPVLQEAGIEFIIVTGIATNVCCECLTRDAMQLNYKVIFVSDATAASTPDLHRAALASVGRFADVMTTDEALRALTAPAERVALPA